MIEGDLYQLSNGNLIRIYSLIDDPESDYGYDYLNGQTKKLIDGGVFSCSKSLSEDVLKEAMRWQDLDVNKISWALVQQNVEYETLEEKGYTGF